MADHAELRIYSGWRFFCFIILLSIANAAINTTETEYQIVLANDRLFSVVNKSTGAIDQLFLDGTNLLGTKSFEVPTPGGATGSGNSGIGPYLDCYCIPSGFYTPGNIDPYFKVFKGNDSNGTPYGGVVMGEIYPATGQNLEQYWFLRDGETGLHMFSRLAYYNESTPFLRNLQEFRTLFRPNTPIWTHLLTNEGFYGPLPDLSNQITVQDATWNVNDSDSAYAQQIGDYFTKYTFSDSWQDHKVHGMFADGSYTPGNETYGAWLVMNTVDTYFGGPTHSDLLVDGIVYNYISSNHHGNNVPNITHGFDRTFGPQYYHFNKGGSSDSLIDLYKDAEQYASPSWNAAFYDSIAEHVPNYIPTSGRGTWRGQIALPKTAIDAVAVLSEPGVDFQDNVFDTKAYQYWGHISTNGSISIPRVKAGTYRLTVYATNVFGQYVQDGIQVAANQTTSTITGWTEESAGTELWRIGTPDRSSGEYRHGYAPSPNGTLYPPEYRIYWAVYDFPSDFPDGVHYTVGQSDPAEDLNYVHWSVFGGKANALRPKPYTTNVNNWTIEFDADKSALYSHTEATLTVQLAGAKTAAGNTDIRNASEPYADLPLTVAVNGHDLEPWIIPANQSSSCAVRSAVICYWLSHKYRFDTQLLANGTNELVLSLPANATDYESALLPESVYVQYDALRLELQ